MELYMKLTMGFTSEKSRADQSTSTFVLEYDETVDPGALARWLQKYLDVVIPAVFMERYFR